MKVAYNKQITLTSIYARAYKIVRVIFSVFVFRMVDVQKPATVVKMNPDDPLYMSFVPALDTAMVAAWHQPKVCILQY